MSLIFFSFFFFQILLEIRVKKAPHTFVCVPVFVHLQNADFVSTSPLRFSQHYGLAGLLVVSLSFIFPHPPEDEKKTKNLYTIPRLRALRRRPSEGRQRNLRPAALRVNVVLLRHFSMPRDREVICASPKANLLVKLSH